LGKAGYDDNNKTLFLWEGVCPYLKPESVNATLEFVSHSANNESIIAFDYLATISAENASNYYGGFEFLQMMKKRYSNEGLKFSIDEGKIESFLGQRGLKTVNYLNSNEIEKIFLLNKTGSLGQIFGLARFVLASPNNKSHGKEK
jgi:O-methyltransferase involved in polyketide biosynthesis